MPGLSKRDKPSYLGAKLINRKLGFDVTGNVPGDAIKWLELSEDKAY
jgi:hypothetical protein